MSKDTVKTIEIKCLNQKCGHWFKSPIFFGNLGTFDTAYMSGNLVQCPYCGKMTPCNKENMRVRADKGGFKGKDTF